jgi:hypothetical protein
LRLRPASQLTESEIQQPHPDQLIAEATAELNGVRPPSPVHDDNNDDNENKNNHVDSSLSSVQKVAAAAEAVVPPSTLPPQSPPPVFVASDSVEKQHNSIWQLLYDVLQYNKSEQTQTLALMRTMADNSTAIRNMMWSMRPLSPGVAAAAEGQQSIPPVQASSRPNPVPEPSEPGRLPPHSDSIPVPPQAGSHKQGAEGHVHLSCSDDDDEDDDFSCSDGDNEEEEEEGEDQQPVQTVAVVSQATKVTGKRSASAHPEDPSNNKYIRITREELAKVVQTMAQKVVSEFTSFLDEQDK